ncbi:MAG: acetoacetate--CoA ligase, partial [Mesorhizobium sp.]
MAGEVPLWTPTQDQIDASPLTAFMKAAATTTGSPFSSYTDLHRWSVENREAFWDLVWDFCGLEGDKGERLLLDGGKMPGASFFPDASLNFAENLLKKTGAGEAIVFRGEDKVERRLSWNELHGLVSRLQQLFLSLKVKKGDRIAAMMPNMPEAVAAMLAAASIGAVWSSCSPDFGEQGVLDRFGQIEPVVFIAPDGYWYNGKAIEVADKVKAVAARLGSVRKVLLVDYLGTSADVADTI